MGRRIDTSGIKIVEKKYLNPKTNFIEKLSVYRKKMYLYFERSAQINEPEGYKVYQISKSTYKKALEDMETHGMADIQELGAYMGKMQLEMYEEEWICRIFKYSRERKEIPLQMIIWSVAILAGFVFIGLGVQKSIYRNNFRERELTTEGTVYKYTRARGKGSRSRLEYYNLYVWYMVEGKSYSGYYGKSSSKPAQNMKVTVHYNRNNPEHTLNHKELSEEIYDNFLWGGVLIFVGTGLLVAEIQKKGNLHRG